MSAVEQLLLCQAAKRTPTRRWPRISRPNAWPVCRLELYSQAQRAVGSMEHLTQDDRKSMVKYGRRLQRRKVNVWRVDC